MSQNRLSKILAKAGVASRRKCETLIFEGKIQVNGEVVKTPQFLVDLKKDVIEFEGKRVGQLEKKVYYLLNKPAGYVCSQDKESYKHIVTDIFPQKERLFTVGRLDKATLGLLIVTNDGHLAHKISHPSFEIEKEYLVKTDLDITDLDLKRIASGLKIEGTFVTPISVTKVRKGTLKITVKEGKKHEVRRLVEQTGAQILELTRVRIGNLRLGSHPIGAYKKVTREELITALELS